MLITSEIFFIVRENKDTGAVEQFVKNIDLKFKKKSMKVELENITGGGFVGDMATQIITLVGEDFLGIMKQVLSKKMRELFQKKFMESLGLDSSIPL